MSGRPPSLLRLDLRRLVSTLTKAAFVADSPFCQLLLVMSVRVALKPPLLPSEIVFLMVSEAAMLDARQHPSAPPPVSSRRSPVVPFS